MRLRWYLFALILFGIALVALFPLRYALDWSTGTNSLLSARQVAGTVWSGRMGDVQLGTERIGTFDVRLRALPLLGGRVEVRAERLDDFEGPLAGDFVVGGGTEGVRGLSGRVAVGRLVQPLPLDALAFDDVDALFENGACARADGTITALPAPGLAAIAAPLSGPLTCSDDGRVQATLVDPRGRQTLTVFIDAQANYELDLALSGVPALLGDYLLLAGFNARGSDYVLRHAGSFE